MTSLRQRMLEDMQVRQLSPCTQQTYVETVARFARHFDRSPARLGPEAIRDYQVYLTNERRLAPSSVVVAVSALRFLYRVTLRKQWVFDDVIPVPKKPRSLPVVLSPDEVVQFLDAVKGRQASRHPDHVLRRRPPRLRGHSSHRARHRQPADGAPHRAGQGEEGPLRDALAQAARGAARLVAGRPAPGIGSFPGSARRSLSLARRSSSPASAPSDARSSPSRFLPTRCATRSRSISSRRAPTSVRFNSCSGIGACRPRPATCRSPPARSARPPVRWTSSRGRRGNRTRTSPERRSCHAPRSPWRRSSAATATPSGPRPGPSSPRRNAG